MEEFKFIHTSNLLILNEYDKNFKALEGITERCFIEEIDALIITGNLFSEEGTLTSVDKMVTLLEEIPNTRIYISLNEKDEENNCIIHLRKNRPINTHIFSSSDIEIFNVYEDINIIGCSYNNEKISLASLNEKALILKEDFNILVISNPTNIKNIDNIVNSKTVSNCISYCATGEEIDFKGFKAVGGCLYSNVGSLTKQNKSRYNSGYILGSIEDGLIDVSFTIQERCSII